jgi:hypothetical protein
MYKVACKRTRSLLVFTNDVAHSEAGFGFEAGGSPAIRKQRDETSG